MRPYPRYRDSGVEWLGELPEHWAVVPLKSMIQTFVYPRGEVRLFRLVPPSAGKSLSIRRFPDPRLPPYHVVTSSTTQHGPNLAPIWGTRL